MKKSYFETKKRRREIAGAICGLLVALFILNGIFFLLNLYEYILTIILFLVLNCLCIHGFFSVIGIKFPKRKVPDWINSQLNVLEKKYDEVDERLNLSKKNSVSAINKTCPNCNNSSNGIVDKIRQTKGDIDGDFFLGCGSIDGEIDTKAVNHCNKCGHEWEKAEIGWKEARESAMDKMLQQIYYFFDKGEDNKSDELKNFSAKAIKMFIKKHQDGYYAKELNKLSISDLKKYGCK